MGRSAEDAPMKSGRMMTRNFTKGFLLLAATGQVCQRKGHSGWSLQLKGRRIVLLLNRFGGRSF
jgi:hypothetical protein